MTQSDAIIYDDTPEAGCFASAALLVIVMLLVILLSARGRRQR